jgi:hypothetical protein
LIEYSATDVPSSFDPGRFIPTAAIECFFASFLIRVGNFTHLPPKNLGGALKTPWILSGTSVADPDNW